MLRLLDNTKVKTERLHTKFGGKRQRENTEKVGLEGKIKNVKTLS